MIDTTRCTVAAVTLWAVLWAGGCSPNETTRQGVGIGGSRPGEKQTLADARLGFKSRVLRRTSDLPAPPTPPPNLFRIVHYQSGRLNLAAYLTPDPKDGKKHPAIIWITGGDCNSIGDVWQEPRPNDDQTAGAFREAGIVMMFPSLRGGNDNPGFKEGFFGEVDDVLAAADFLAKQDFVDPERIYLGGHSTGGTLVFLVAECSDRFRAVFSFGPADDVSGYDPKAMPFDMNNPREVELRSPGKWLHSVQSPLFVFEGTVQGNIDALRAMQCATTNPKIHFHPVKGATHFSILQPTTRLIAAKILRDSGPATNLSFAEDELNKPFSK
jgi:acetyl esterase/lipase